MGLGAGVELGSVVGAGGMGELGAGSVPGAAVGVGSGVGAGVGAAGPAPVTAGVCRAGEVRGAEPPGEDGRGAEVRGDRATGGPRGLTTEPGRAVVDGPAGTGMRGAGTSLLRRSVGTGAGVDGDVTAGAVPGSARNDGVPAPARTTTPARTATPTPIPAAAPARRSGGQIGRA
ncbi:MAG: hypothetical protein JWR66_3624, partial [Modestobacter sp.]|nr:hypothetical protein [Modestobacter sp.]